MTDTREIEQQLADTRRHRDILLDIVRRQRDLANPEQIMLASAEALAVHLGVDRAGFYQVQDAETVVFAACWSNGTLPQLSGTWATRDMGEGYRQDLQQGNSISITDIQSDARTRDGRFSTIGTRAVLGVPIHRAGRWRAGMFLNARDVRQWHSEEIDLAQNVADLTWDAVERARLYLEMRTNQERVRTIVNASLDAIVMTDPAGVITEWNRPAESMFGWTRAEAVGRRVHELSLPPEHHDEYDAQITRYLETGDDRQLSRRIERVAVTKDGTRLPVELNTVAEQFDSQIWFITFVRDITGQREASRALFESQERSRLTVESIRDYAIMSLDGEGRVVGWNSGAELLFGYPVADMIGQSASAIFTAEDLADDAFITELRIATETGRAIDERWHRRRDQSRFFGSGVLSAIRDRDGNVTGFTKIVRDVTAQKMAEELLIEARNAAQAASRAKTEFLANMSHEIRTPMNAVIGIANLLAMSQPLTDRQREFIRTLQLSADALLRLLNDLLDISKIESRSVDLERIPFSVPGMLQDIARITLPKAQEKGIAFTVETNCAPDRLHIGDPTRLRQIILNLCSNAVKFTGQGFVAVTLHCRPGEQPGTELVCVSVKDSGIGVPQDRLASIFEKFTQADSSITRKFGGTGLGLAITRTLAEVMGGTVTVDSEEGRGSTFTVTLPLPVATDTPSPAYGDGMHFTSQDIRKPFQKTVLVVEDHPANILVVTSILEQYGYTFQVATTGAEGVEMARSGTYSAVLMDVQMPGMNGFEATEQIRTFESEAGRPAVPIIGMTAHAMVGDRDRCLAAGMDDYLAKPFDPENLRRKLDALVFAGGQ
ncbi:MAG: PAS domain S-box protein [Asticcacaulis sp.]|nr:PAS domain S-box protein [Asticcacaulis sp.]